MTDDGQTVILSQPEYDQLMGQIHRMFHDHTGRWSFPWTGPRSVYVSESLTDAQKQCLPKV